MAVMNKLLVLALLASCLSSVGCAAEASSTKEQRKRSDAHAGYAAAEEDGDTGRHFAAGLLGVDSDAEATKGEQKYRAVVDGLIAQLDENDEKYFVNLSVELDSGDPERVATATMDLQTKLDAAAKSAKFNQRMNGGAAIPTFSGLKTKDTGGGSTSQLGMCEEGRFGDEKTGPSGALQDLRALPSMSAAGVAQRGLDLVDVQTGKVTPDPESRLGAFEATKGYPPGTVGAAVHVAIGTIYVGMGTYGEEKIGRIFNSPEAKALYDQPVDSPAGAKMAALEHQYWENVRKEDPYSMGGQLGSAFSPAARDWLQKNAFTR